ncbi:MAG: Uma2 family endonuclease [Leptothrix ochracea]|jgi:Uma2 family endonuclease|uniref:Uma2 family endonuclease n=1 Tax=Leptothrix ochracea TaxID=735331 RepID=UPI0034E218DD
MSSSTDKMTLEEFRTLEKTQPAMHEFVRGEARPRSVPGRAHSDVVMNLVGLLWGALKGTPCRIYSETMQVQVAEDAVLYPDVTITCDPDDMKGRTLRSPSLVIEVLSSATQSFDRSSKFAMYRRLSSLQEYVMVDPESKWIEVFRRTPEGLWALHDITEETLLLAAVGTELSMSDIFNGMGSD